ncbi:TPA: hypothetical protein EYP70_03120 [Candidatus Bathyarchaeota archaeon]|nr:hypothetical protein [Candidatus Bathyarchaeota archaeon]
MIGGLYFSSKKIPSHKRKREGGKEHVSPRRIHVLIVIIIVVASLSVYYTYFHRQPSPEEERYIGEIKEILVLAIKVRGELKYLLDEEPTGKVFYDYRLTESFKNVFIRLLERYGGLNPPNESYQNLHKYVGEYLNLNLKGFDFFERAVREQDATLLKDAFSRLRQADELREKIKKELKILM